MVAKDPDRNKFLTEHGDGHLTSDHHVIGDIFLYVAYREVSPITATKCTPLTKSVPPHFFEARVGSVSPPVF